MHKYTAILTRDTQDGGWVAQCAEVPAAITQGETAREATQNLRDAIKYMLGIEARLSLQNARRGARVIRVRVPA